MSKDIIKARKEEKKDAADLASDLQKFDANKEPTAKDCRATAEVNGAATIKDQVENAWVRVVAAIKASVARGGSSVQVPAGPTNHPDVREQVIKRLDKAGFRHELNGGMGYIYW
jgi:hypothetical protein